MMLSADRRRESTMKNRRLAQNVHGTVVTRTIFGLRL